MTATTTKTDTKSQTEPTTDAKITTIDSAKTDTTATAWTISQQLDAKYSDLCAELGELTYNAERTAARIKWLKIELDKVITQARKVNATQAPQATAAPVPGTA